MSHALTFTKDQVEKFSNVLYAPDDIVEIKNLVPRHIVDSAHKAHIHEFLPSGRKPTAAERKAAEQRLRLITVTRLHIHP